MAVATFDLCGICAKECTEVQPHTKFPSRYYFHHLLHTRDSGSKNVSFSYDEGRNEFLESVQALKQNHSISSSAKALSKYRYICVDWATVVCARKLLGLSDCGSLSPTLKIRSRSGKCTVERARGSENYTGPETQKAT